MWVTHQTKNFSLREGLSQTYGTPWHIVRALEDEIGRRFTLDVCAESWSRKCDLWFDEKMDGLKQPWTDWSWCNPPYSNQQGWLRRGVEQAKRGIHSAHLILASTSASYWRELAFESGTVDFYEGRIAFLHPVTHQPVKGFSHASAVVLLGPRFPPGVIRVRSALTGHRVGSGTNSAARMSA